jgi:hypothetical protein
MPSLSGAVQVTNFVRGAITRARGRKFSYQSIIDLALDAQIDVGIKRAALEKFHKSKVAALSKDSLNELHVFFATTPMGRAMSSDNSAPSGGECLLHQIKLGSLPNVYDGLVEGLYFGYHVSLLHGSDCFAVRAIRIYRTADGSLATDDFLVDAYVSSNTREFNYLGTVVVCDGSNLQNPGIQFISILNDQTKALRLFQMTSRRLTRT